MSDGIGMEDLQQGTPWWGGKGCEMGDKIAGLITYAGKEQQRDFDSGELMTWDNGDPRMELVVHLQTDVSKYPTAQRDDIEDDDGVRALHLRGGRYEVAKGTGKAGADALKDAIRSSGLRAKPDIWIEAEITGMAKATGRGKNPAKLWTITLSEPEPGIDAEDLFDD